MLVVIQTLAEGCEMFVAVPFCVVGILEGFLGLDIERASSIVEMVQDLEGGDVVIRGEPVF